MPNRSLEQIKEDLDQAIARNDAEALLRYASELDALDTKAASALSGNSRGRALALRGDYIAAMTHYHRALELYEELGDRSGVASVTNNIGNVLKDTGDYTAALTHFQQVLALHEELSNRGGVASTTGNIGNVHQRTGNYPAALSHYQQALTLHEELGERKGVAIVTGNIGLVHQSTGDYPEALSHYRRALALHEELGDRSAVASVTNNIGLVHKDTGDYPEALIHFHRALALHEELGERSGVAGTTSNIGNVHHSTGDYPEALSHYQRALALCEEIGHRHFAAIITGNIGNVHKDTGDYPGALSHYKRALALHEELGERSGVAGATGNIGLVHYSTGDYPEALNYFQRALALHEELGDRKGVVATTGSIVAAYLEMGSDAEAQALLQTMDDMQIDDPGRRVLREHLHAKLQERSGDLDGAAVSLQRALTEASEHKRRAHVADTHKALRDLALKQNNLAGYVEHNNEFTRITEEINGKETTLKLAMQAKQREIDAKEKEVQKHMAVLHSTLPKHIADRVARGEVVNDHYDNAAVIFLDIVGFTTISDRIPSGHVVHLLEQIFTTLDAVCEKHNVVKIKTIGDSYMAVAFQTANVMPSEACPAEGRIEAQRTANVMPSEACPAEGRIEAQRTANVGHIHSAAACAREMIASLDSLVITMPPALGDTSWVDDIGDIKVRIGMHCGPVTAGVIGTQRMQYDVWGDTVNVASRMESTSEPGKIHVSETLANALTEALTEALTVPRGTVDVKGKGMMKTFWLE